MKKIIMFLCMTLCFMGVSIAQLHFYVHSTSPGKSAWVVRFDGDAMYMVCGYVTAIRGLLEDNRDYFESMTEKTPHSKGIFGETMKPSPVKKYIIDNRINVNGRVVYSNEYIHLTSNHGGSVFWSVKDDYTGMKNLLGKYPNSIKETPDVLIEVPEEYILTPAKVNDDVLRLFDD